MSNTYESNRLAIFLATTSKCPVSSYHPQYLLIPTMSKNFADLSELGFWLSTIPTGLLAGSTAFK